MGREGLHLMENQIRPNGRRKLARRGLGAILMCVRRLRPVDRKEGRRALNVSGESGMDAKSLRRRQKWYELSRQPCYGVTEESFGRCRV
jgi:hypothetical protein